MKEFAYFFNVYVLHIIADFPGLFNITFFVQFDIYKYTHNNWRSIIQFNILCAFMLLHRI